MSERKKLLGSLPFVSRTYEGGFKENPYILDMDANLYIGPADHVARDEHAAIEAIVHFLQETGRGIVHVKEILKDRCLLLDAFRAFDEARTDSNAHEFQIVLFGTYDGELLIGAGDDDLPAGPCGKSVNEIKARFYDLCSRADKDFHKRELTPEQLETEARFLSSSR